VHIWNVTTGTRLVTYAVEAEAGSGIICVNGAAAHLNRPGELVILATFAECSREEAIQLRPQVIFVDSHNRITTPPVNQKLIPPDDEAAGAVSSRGSSSRARRSDRDATRAPAATGSND
jgi:aspartate 1-decarboxylase